MSFTGKAMAVSGCCAASSSSPSSFLLTFFVVKFFAAMGTVLLLPALPTTLLLFPPLITLPVRLEGSSPTLAGEALPAGDEGAMLPPDGVWWGLLSTLSQSLMRDLPPERGLDRAMRRGVLDMVQPSLRKKSSKPNRYLLPKAWLAIVRQYKVKKCIIN